MDAKTLLAALCGIPFPSGYEYMGYDALAGLAREMGIRGEIEPGPFGGLCVKLNPGASAAGGRVLIDAHIDEIGLVVSGIDDRGFLRLRALGGVDPGTLQGERVWVYTCAPDGSYEFSAERRIMGVVCSTPPHLASGDAGLTPADGLYADVGYSADELKGMVRAGSPVLVAVEPAALAGDGFAGRGLDNKAGVAAVLLALAAVKKPQMEVLAVFSVGEETTGSGARSAAYGSDASFAIVVDTNYAAGGGVPAHESLVPGKGPGVSLSASTNLELSRRVIRLAAERGIPCQAVAEPMSTGTNAAYIRHAKRGIPCVAVGIPLKNMHTQSEVVRLADVEATAELLAAVIAAAVDN